MKLGIGIAEIGPKVARSLDPGFVVRAGDAALRMVSPERQRWWLLSKAWAEQTANRQLEAHVTDMNHESLTPPGLAHELPPLTTIDLRDMSGSIAEPPKEFVLVANSH